MKLDEAIKHATAVAKDKKNCPKCRAEHLQLVSWLRELKTSRKVIKELKQTIKNNNILTKPVWEWLAKEGVIV